MLIIIGGNDEHAVSSWRGEASPRLRSVYLAVDKQISEPMLLLLHTYVPKYGP